MGKKKRKCAENNKKVLWYSLNISNLILRTLSTIALLLIATNLTAIKKQDLLTKICIEEIQKNGLNLSKAVNFCHGGSQ